jgi:hypothetical protein
VVEVTFTDKDGRLAFTAEGHSGYGEYGKDIVCAAVSALAFTLAGNAEDMKTNGWLVRDPEIDMETGAKVVCAPKKECIAEARLVFCTVMTGFVMLENSYPEHVHVTLLGESESS